MKAEDLKFPLIIKWYGDTRYVVEEDALGQFNWTNIGTRRYHHNCISGRVAIAEAVADGNASIIASPQPTNQLAKLTVDVDTTQLQEATKAADALVAALSRVKAVLA